MIELSKDEKKDLAASIKRYFQEELDEEVGDLKAALFLDFCLAEIGGKVYNRAIADAKAYTADPAAEMDGALFAPEGGCWKKGGV